MNTIKNNIYFKMGAILAIIVVLMIPTSMIQSLIRDREDTQNKAIKEVGSKWGNSQTIIGPIISIPYIKYRVSSANKDSNTVVATKEYLHILPSQLTINGELKPEQRNRGIYEIVVYNSTLRISGTFEDLNLAALDIDPTSIQFEKAEFVIGIDDLRGIEQQVALTWDGQQQFFNSGVSSTDVVESGIHSVLSLNRNGVFSHRFDVNLELKGSQYLHFTPVGKVTDVVITSTWPNPSFDGSFLPDSRTVSDTGFVANWNVLHLNRNYPQSWTSNQHKVKNSTFGVDLLLPVDRYQKSYRSIQYAILFIFFTFMVFFFIEVLNKVFIHPIQYILVGVALVVFFTLLLSISEHIAYNAAYIVSAFATLLLIAGYVKAILKSNPLTMLISGILGILYGFIFVIIQLQDYALLIGSIGIFIILGLTMYFSRQIDWSTLKMGDVEVETGP